MEFDWNQIPWFELSHHLWWGCAAQSLTPQNQLWCGSGWFPSRTLCQQRSAKEAPASEMDISQLLSSSSWIHKIIFLCFLCEQARSISLLLEMSWFAQSWSWLSSPDLWIKGLESMELQQSPWKGFRPLETLLKSGRNPRAPRQQNRPPVLIISSFFNQTSEKIPKSPFYWFLTSQHPSKQTWTINESSDMQGTSCGAGEKNVLC